MNKFVWEVEQLPSTEFFGWLAYYEEKERKNQVQKGNIMAMNEDEIIKAFT